MGCNLVIPTIVLTYKVSRSNPLEMKTNGYFLKKIENLPVSNFFKESIFF
jgi:hypothetical protein